MKTLRPLLAVAPQNEITTWPMLASPKIDGIRAFVKDGQFLSRSAKPIPNQHVQAQLKGYGSLLDHLDGELVVGEPTDYNLMQQTTSGVMSKAGEPDFRWYVFDRFANPEVPYALRLNSILDMEPLLPPWVVIVEQRVVFNQIDLDQFEDECLAVGYEGVMLRAIDAPYKFGRSTEREGILFKIKRFTDGEAEVIGVTELMYNENEAFRDSQNFKKRSSSQNGKKLSGLLGSLVLSDRATGQTFEVGTGFTMEQRQQFWQDQDALLGQLCKYKHFAAGGVKDKPRFPVFLGFRDPIDM